MEAARRGIFFGFKDGEPYSNPLLLLAYPSYVKKAVKQGYFKPYNPEIPRALNWYKLTGKGINVIQSWGLTKDDFDDHDLTPSAIEKINRINP